MSAQKIGWIEAAEDRLNLGRALIQFRAEVERYRIRIAQSALRLSGDAAVLPDRDVKHESHRPLALPPSMPCIEAPDIPYIDIPRLDISAIDIPPPDAY